METQKFVCIHGHFYQPPRENPWLESIELQDSAYPYHDWNARITAECYGPNTTSRILEPGGKIIGIMNNFSRISFNLGPTLLSWMESAEPVIYESILEADRISQDLYSGHGTAIAQVYNHIIMPLANSRDKRTQVLWGIADFEHRFGRRPEGMWLAETAVDLETLDILAEEGIKFTILAPRQASRVRRTGEEDWHDVSHDRVDPRRPYLCRLPSGRSISLFFYDGPMAQDLAFGGLLHNGEVMASRFLSSFAEEADSPQIVHVAADGETFGHHHKQGEMALSYCLRCIERNPDVRLTNYAEYLELSPPDWEVEIFENSSWSCVHGVGRWKENCGCNSGMHGDWSQEWRQPLREALDWLRDKAAEIFEGKASDIFEDPWTVRNDYIEAILDRSPGKVEKFIDEKLKVESSSSIQTRALKLLELQRHSLLMYTSCGWFFDEISGIETTQVLRYAARAIQLVRELGGSDYEYEFAERLSRAPSNIPENRDGRHIYENMVKPVSVDLMRVGIHYAVTSLFEEYDEETQVFCFDVKQDQYWGFESGNMRMAIGEITIMSRLTLQEARYTFAVMHLGDHNLSGGIRESSRDDSIREIHQEFRDLFNRSDVPEMIRRLDEHFGDRKFSFWYLFLDEKRKIMSALFEEAEKSVENFYRRVYHDHYPLMSTMNTVGLPLPRALKETVDYVLNLDLSQIMSSLPVDEPRFRSTLEEIRKWNARVDGEKIGYTGSQQLAELSDELIENPLSFDLMERMQELLSKYNEIGAPLNLWYTQNALYEIGLQQLSIRKYLAEEGDVASKEWAKKFETLCDKMGVKIE